MTFSLPAPLHHSQPVGLLLVLAVAVSALADTACADEPWAVPGRVYVDFAGGVEWVNLPHVFSSVPGFAPTDDEFSRWTAEALIGFADREGLALPDPIGQNARIELQVRYGEGQSTSKRSGFSDFFALFGEPTEGLTNSSLQTWDVLLSYQTDVPLSDHVVFSPRVGLAYSRLDLANDFKIVATRAGGPRSAELNDEVIAHYYGLALGADLTMKPAAWIEFALGLRADLMGASADLDVRFATVVTRHPRPTAEANDSNFAPRARASVGTQLNLGPLALGVEAFVHYLAYLPVADHTGPRAPNIDGEDLWGAGGKAHLTIWWR